VAASSGAPASAVRAASSNARWAATHAEMTGPTDAMCTVVEEPDLLASAPNWEWALVMRTALAVAPPPARAQADSRVEQTMTVSVRLQVHKAHHSIPGRVPCLIGSGPYESAPGSAMNIARWVQPVTNPVDPTPSRATDRRS
jgi:hypothetical protein